MPHAQYFKLSDPTVYMIALTSFEISFLSFERCFIKTKQLHLVILLLKITQVKNLAKCHLKTRCHCVPFKFQLLQFKTTLTGRELLIATPCYVELQLLFHQSQILCSRSISILFMNVICWNLQRVPGIFACIKWKFPKQSKRQPRSQGLSSSPRPCNCSNCCTTVNISSASFILFLAVRWHTNTSSSPWSKLIFDKGIPTSRQEYDKCQARRTYRARYCKVHCVVQLHTVEALCADTPVSGQFQLRTLFLLPERVSACGSYDCKMN